MNAYIAGREIDLHSIDEWACMYRITMYGDSDINSVLHIADEFRKIIEEYELISVFYKGYQFIDDDTGSDVMRIFAKKSGMLEEYLEEFGIAL